MNLLARLGLSFLLAATPLICLMAQNQTELLSPVVSEETLPFTLQIEQAPFLLPTGLQAFASANYKGKWILIGGRTNGLHGFSDIGNNFPPSFQNTRIFVIDPQTGTSMSRSMAEEGSGFSPEDIDALSVVASQFFQKESTLYIVGGYGINSFTGEMETKSTLTALNLKEILRWVKRGKSHPVKSLRQVSHPLLQVTGGFLFQNSPHDPFLLMLGQNFIGLYKDGSNGIYTRQIRRFWLNDDGKHVSILPKVSTRVLADYRRRDLNIIPVMRNNLPAYTAFAGVFTLDTGVWTVPITIFPDGSSFQPDPEKVQTFKQAMNHYNCPAFGLYSVQSKDMYAVFPGGISYGYFSGGTFQVDSEIPFINQVTTIKIDQHDRCTQHLMNGEYPFIASTGSNPGNQLLFGAEAQFFPAENVPLFANGVIRLDSLPSEPIIIGHIVGGIMSTVPNTTAASDSTASPYVFTVRLIPK